MVCSWVVILLAVFILFGNVLFCQPCPLYSNQINLFPYLLNTFKRDKNMLKPCFLFLMELKHYKI